MGSGGMLSADEWAGMHACMARSSMAGRHSASRRVGACMHRCSAPVLASTSLMTWPYTILASSCAWLRSVLGSSVSVGWMQAGIAVWVELMPDARKILDTKACLSGVQHCGTRRAVCGWKTRAGDVQQECR